MIRKPSLKVRNFLCLRPRTGMSLLLVSLMVLASCHPSPSPDELAEKMLADARQALQRRDYSAARDSIKSLRIKYPTALEARRQAILLLDSVELAYAIEEVAPVGPVLEKERELRDELMRTNAHYKKDPLYHEVNRKVFALEQLYDSLATKVKFFERKIEEDRKK